MTATVNPSQSPAFKPFETIALAFSGGGFRASNYALGVISLLQAVEDEAGQPLLQRVRYIASASGGTITASLYALYSAKRGFDFTTFYRSFIEFHRGDELMKNALKILSTDSYWNDGTHCKQRNLINAFSIAYNQSNCFNGATFGDLVPEDRNDYHHIEELCFNSTDMFKGLTFRQQLCVGRNARARMFFGNNYLVVNKQRAKNLRLADALAASSCFPGGFEPILFPNDFARNDEHKKDLIDAMVRSLNARPNVTATDEEVEFLKQNGFGLMDGGITDNQGLYSLMQADERRAKSEAAKKMGLKRFDLILVNDVSSHYMDAYKMPDGAGNAFTNKFTLRGVFWLIVSVNVLSLAGLLLFTLPNTGFDNVFAVLGLSLFFGASATILIIWLWLQRMVFGSAKGTLNLQGSYSADIVSTLKNYFGQTPLTVLWGLLKSRGLSLLSLNMDLFLKSSRRLIYNRFYQSPLWKNRGKGNHIYDLSQTNIKRMQQDLQKDVNDDALRIKLYPSKAILDTAEDAFKMPTTLWFDKTHEKLDTRAKIIATGQFTTCHNLIMYILKLKKENVWDDFSKEEQHRVNHIYGQLIALWDRFQAEPHFLHQQMLDKK